MTENCKLRKGYIIRILQHFATKLSNIINFVMLFQAVVKFLSRLVEFKILVNCMGNGPLKIFVKEFAITGEAIRIILAGILSIPVDLQGFKNKRSLYTLDSDTA
jgi:hypothetical protein